MRKKIFTVATAHLDTVWNWPLEKTIETYIKNTLTDNFDLFEKFPDYKFNFEGAYRYELMEEYYPELFEKLKDYVKQGRWYPCGSSYENGDVNVPSPEALFRNILYGNAYFDKTFGIRSKDIFLPDCFGFGWALPAIMRHAHLHGFSSQKLSWGSANGVPFDVGKWYGSNGDWVYAFIKPGRYSYTFKEIRGYKNVVENLAQNEKIGLPMTAVYHGTGDVGGAPKIESVRVLEKEIGENASSETEVLSSRVEDVFEYLHDMDKSLRDRLPEHKKEFVMTCHAVGGYTSRAVGKRWNKRNEILADICERSNVVADLLGQKAYPSERIDCHWKRVIAHQFHDDLPGTSLQKVYKRSWNDYMVSLNGFSDEYNSSVAAIASQMDTRTDGVCVLVNNPAEYPKTGAVSVKITAEGKYVKVTDATGKIVPSQVVDKKGNELTVVFVAEMRALDYACFTVRSASSAYKNALLKVSSDGLENEKYTVKLNANGDVCSVYDKLNGHELLSRPVRHDFFRYLGSKEYPAWEIPYTTCNRLPPEHAKLVSVRIAENGGARVALKVVQKYGESLFSSVISLTAGGETVDVRCEADWRSPRRLMKEDFGFAVSNPEATYDLGLGTVKRGNNTKNLYEVPAQDWADLTDKKNNFGVSVLSECKFGWDKPDDNTLRLTILHTPIHNFHKFDSVQSKMELGLNRYGYALFSHSGAVGKDTQIASRKYLLPMPTFVCSAHGGTLGAQASFLRLSDDGVLIKAIKKALVGDEYVVRFYEGENKKHKGVTFTLGSGILSAREIYASEEYKGEAVVNKNGALVFDMRPYEVKSFALTLNKTALVESAATSVILPSDTPLVTPNGNRGAVTIAGTTYSLPAEQWSERYVCGGVPFALTEYGTLCRGQKIALKSNTRKIFLLACSLTGEKTVTLRLGKEYAWKVSPAGERVGGWDLFGAGQTAFVRTDAVAKEITHTHSPKGDNIAKQFYIFRYEFATDGAKQLVLPFDEDILIFALTESAETASCVPANFLYDTVNRRKFDYSDDFIERIVERHRIKHADRREK